MRTTAKTKARTTTETKSASGNCSSLRVSLQGAAVLGLLLAAIAMPAVASDSGTLRYSASRTLVRGPTAIKVPEASYESIRPSSVYRKETVLRYSKRLGKTGLEFRVKAPLKPRRLLKLELRF